MTTIITCSRLLDQAEGKSEEEEDIMNTSLKIPETYVLIAIKNTI